MSKEEKNPFAWNEAIQKMFTVKPDEESSCTSFTGAGSSQHSYTYYIYLLEQSGKEYNDYIEGVGADPGAFWVGNDFSVAKGFGTVEELHYWAHEHGLKDGQYAVHGFFDMTQSV